MTRFVVNRRAVKQLARGPKVRKTVERVAEEVAAQTRRNAAGRQRIAASVYSTVSDGPDGQPVGEVGFGGKFGFISRFHEFGTVKMSPRPMLRPAALSVLARTKGRYKPGRRTVRR